MNSNFAFIHGCFYQKNGCVFVQNTLFFHNSVKIYIFDKKVIAIFACFVYNVFCSGVSDTQRKVWRAKAFPKGAHKYYVHC